MNTLIPPPPTSPADALRSLLGADGALGAAPTAALAALADRVRPGAPQAAHALDRALTYLAETRSQIAMAIGELHAATTRPGPAPTDPDLSRKGL